MGKTDDDIRDELAFNLANSILEESLSSRDNIVKSLSTISAVAIPAYVGALKIYESTLSSVHMLVKVTPVLLWAVALFICFLILFPRNAAFDLKNLPGIINIHYDSVKRARNSALIAGAVQIIGLVVAAVVFMW